jgi:hypothetical protein
MLTRASDQSASTAQAPGWHRGTCAGPAHKEPLGSSKPNRVAIGFQVFTKVFLSEVARASANVAC